MAYQSAGFTTIPYSFYARKKERLAKRRQGILYVPGLTGTVYSWRDGAEVKATWKACAEHRFRLLSIAESIKWGNSIILAQLDIAYALARDSFGFRERVHLFCASGGGAAVFNWAAANRDKVASVAAVIPALDIQDIHDHQRTAAIGLPDATFGPKVAYANARPPDASNPASNPTDYAGLPMLIYYGATDPVCVPAAAEAFGAATGATLVELPGGHSSVGMGAGDVRDFFASHANHP